ncbi:MAG: TRAP transporter substrate-binding protein [Deltaproteobacteria bacterium]|nr:TRAP transporter substrate-binding protein [Deltaproteobacteria bacterium]
MKKVYLTGVLLVIFFGVFTWFTLDWARAETVNLKFSHFMSPKHIQHQKSFEPFCKKVEELSGGKVMIKIYSGGALGDPKQLPDAVKDGITDIAFIIPSYTTARFPRISVMDLPFLGDSAVHGTKVIYDLWDKYFAEDLKDYKVLWLYNAGPGQLMSVDKPMQTLEDIKGLKMRTPSAYMSKLLNVLRANPVGMPISELTMSLQKKVIDGVLTPFSAVTDFRLFDLIGHITEANVYITPMAVVMNKEKWNSLPNDAKKAIDKAAGEKWGIHASQVYDDHDQNTLKEIRAKGKIKVYKLPEGERQRIIKAVSVLEKEWVDDMSKKGFPAAQMMADVQASFKKNR